MDNTLPALCWNCGKHFDYIRNNLYQKRIFPLSKCWFVDCPECKTPIPLARNGFKESQNATITTNP